MSKRFLFTLLFLLVIAILGAVSIFLAKGYTFSTSEKRIVGTGIITVASKPDAASVFIDGHLTTATNATIGSLPPKTYTVKVIKDNFIPWERQVEVKEGVVTPVKVTLFPSIPTTYPLTYNGIINPVLSPDGAKLAFVVPKLNSKGEEKKKPGVWVWTMATNQPISFVRSSEPHQIASSLNSDFSQATLRWSPDSKQVLATVGENNFLLNADNLNNQPIDITPTLIGTLNSWDEDSKAKETAMIVSVKNLSAQKIASNSGFVSWSPDETKFMFRQTSISDKEIGKPVTGIKVYDLEKNKQYVIPDAKSHTWLPDSEHIILVDDNTISIADFDGTNKAVIYAGNFEDSLVFPWPDSSRMVFITSFPTPTASEPNLYGVNLK